MNYCHTAADQSYPWAAFSFLRILLLSRSPQAVAQTASHVGICDRSRLRINAARFRTLRDLCSSAPHGGALARGV
jgi:hypothetical protein